MPTLSLLRQGNELADAREQRRRLERTQEVPTFDGQLKQLELPPLASREIQTLQINVGRVCNQTCTHCHVDAGPDRKESMSREVARQCIEALKHSGITTLDITGGAPEMNENFRWLVQQARQLDKHVIDRCNLTILVANGFKDLPEFLAANQVEIVASLPCYLEENTDSQRGKGVYAKSIEALQRLNRLGYGQPDSELELTLVFNPLGPKLPPEQSGLEEAYRKELRQRFGIEFTRLFTITNLPVSRFLEELVREGQLDSYLQVLVDQFNPGTVDGLMCRSTVSVDWRGYLYDCDFNQMLELPVSADTPNHISDFRPEAFEQRPIVTGRHCFGCTAGAGSGCTGAIL